MKLFYYFGAKTDMLADIYAAMNPVMGNVDCVVDVFGGSGCVILNLPFKRKMLIYNDKDKWLYSVFKAVIDPTKRAELEKRLGMSIRDRSMFDDLKGRMDRGEMPEDDVDRAFITIYVHNASFGGAGADMGTYKKYHVVSGTSEEYLRGFSRQAARTFIAENLDYTELLKKYDGERTLFYLDPPYISSGTNYRSGAFSIGDYEYLATRLRLLKGFWLLNETSDALKPIFGEPQMDKQYQNHTAPGKQGMRTEHYWHNFYTKLKRSKIYDTEIQRRLV